MGQSADLLFRWRIEPPRSRVQNPRASYCSQHQGAGVWGMGAAIADKPAVELWKEEQSVRAASFSPDGTRLVAVGLDQGAMVYDLKESRENPIVAIRETSDSLIRSAAIAKDNYIAVTGHEDGGVRRWRIADGGSNDNVTLDLAELVTELRGHGGAVRRCGRSSRRWWGSNCCRPPRSWWRRVG